MATIQLPTISSIISWANDNALIHDVQFFRGNRECPYVFKDGLFWYFKRQDIFFELQMTSLHDLESFS